MSSGRFDNNELRMNSTKRLVCGIMLCRNSPIKQCPRCLIHFETHCNIYYNNIYSIYIPKIYPTV